MKRLATILIVLFVLGVGNVFADVGFDTKVFKAVTDPTALEFGSPEKTYFNPGDAIGTYTFVRSDWGVSAITPATKHINYAA